MIKTLFQFWFFSQKIWQLSVRTLISTDQQLCKLLIVSALIYDLILILHNIFFWTSSHFYHFLKPWTIQLAQSCLKGWHFTEISSDDFNSKTEKNLLKKSSILVLFDLWRLYSLCQPFKNWASLFGNTFEYCFILNR